MLIKEFMIQAFIDLPFWHEMDIIQRRRKLNFENCLDLTKTHIVD